MWASVICKGVRSRVVSPVTGSFLNINWGSCLKMPGRVRGIAGSLSPFLSLFLFFNTRNSSIAGKCWREVNWRGLSEWKGTVLVLTFSEDALGEVHKSEDACVLFGKSFLCWRPSLCYLEAAINKPNLTHRSVSSPEWEKSRLWYF